MRRLTFLAIALVPVAGCVLDWDSLRSNGNTDAAVQSPADEAVGHPSDTGTIHPDAAVPDVHASDDAEIADATLDEAVVDDTAIDEVVLVDESDAAIADESALVDDDVPAASDDAIAVVDDVANGGDDAAVAVDETVVPGDDGGIIVVTPPDGDSSIGADAGLPDSAVVVTDVTVSTPDAVVDASTGGMDAGLGDAAVDARDAGPADTSYPVDSTTSGDGCVVVDQGTQLLVINEVKTSSASISADEFVEVYNPTSYTIPIAGMALYYISATGTFPNEIGEIPASALPLVAHGFFVFTGAAFTPVAGIRSQALYYGGPSGVLANSGGGLALSRTGDTGLCDPLIDPVGYGTGRAVNSYSNNMPAPLTSTQAAAGDSTGRVPDGHDTGNQSTDFHVSTTPTPGAPNH